MDSRFPTRPSIFGLTRPELLERFAGWGFSPVHVARLWSYLYWSCVPGWEFMPELPAKVRSRLEDAFTLIPPAVARETLSNDGFTRKYLLALEDGRAVETVLMRFKGRVTACVSSQVGCAMGCGFCATGQMGYIRNLSAEEIVAQALHIQRLLRTGAVSSRHEAEGIQPDRTTARLRNMVLMGMGEPLHNYDAVMRAVDILRDQSGFALGASRITLSTVGVIPGIRRLTEEARPVHLAVSLHAATQEERAALVPVAHKWPLDELIDACRDYCSRLGRRVFFEWTLIDGVNDGAEQAHAVGVLLRNVPAQVNIIPLNPTSGFGGVPGRGEAARRFQHILVEHYGLPSTIRQRRGLDIAAGCGQLIGRKT
ncbi:MAG: 23S rRNA (adenine(2503)-C(2))-methyltransferase RlmN [Opitutaceae bacterium]|jgi:23S rRNA (adenine2503-C2)-methyltransferase